MNTQTHYSPSTPAELCRAHSCISPEAHPTARGFPLWITAVPTGRLHGSWAPPPAIPSSTVPGLAQSLHQDDVPTPQHRLTTRISVPRHSASACRTNLFRILRCSSMVASTSFCLPIAAGVSSQQCQGPGAADKASARILLQQSCPCL